MLNRKETYRKKRNTVVLKLAIALMSMLLILGGTLTVSFANGDLDVMLTNWFEKNRENAIVAIQTAVSSEKEIQKTRLRDAIKTEMAAAEDQLEQITEAEKTLRIQNLKEYTDQLIEGINIDNSAEEQKIKNQLASIYAEAVNALNSANTSWKSSTPPVTPEEPAQPEEPGDASEAPEAEGPKAEEPAAAPETPVTAPPEAATPPADQSAIDESSEASENTAGDDQ